MVKVSRWTTANARQLPRLHDRGREQAREGRDVVRAQAAQQRGRALCQAAENRGVAAACHMGTILVVYSWHRCAACRLSTDMPALYLWCTHGTVAQLAGFAQACQP